MTLLGPSDKQKRDAEVQAAYTKGLNDGLHMAWIRVRERLREMHMKLGPMIFDIDGSVTLHEIQTMLEQSRLEIRDALEKP